MMNKFVKNKKLLVGIWITLVILFLVGVIYYWSKYWFTPNARANYFNKENLVYIKNYLINNYKDSYPIPEWDVVFLDKYLKPIVVSNEKNVLAQNPDIYVIQWNTCNIDVGQWDYEKKKYDMRFSDEKTKKCFSYAVTRDRQHFQLGTILYQNWKYVSYFDWNFSWNITKDYQSENTVPNNSDKFFPYYPWFNNTISLELLTGKADLYVNYNFAKYNYKIKDWKITLPADTNLELSFNWNWFAYKLVYPNWNIQILWPNSDQKLSFVIKKFKYDNKSTELLIKDFIWKLWNVFVSNGEDSDNRIYDSKWLLFEIFLGNTNFLSDDKITGILLTSGKTRFSKLKYEYIFDKINDYRGFDKDGSYVDLAKNWFNSYLKDLFEFSVFVNDNIGNKTEIAVSGTGKIQNNFLKYVLENNKNIFYQKSYIITWNNINLSVNIFKWYFDESFTSKFYNYVDKSDVPDFSIITLFGKICDGKSLVSVSQFGTLFDYRQNTIEFKQKISNILPENYVLYLYNPASKLLGISHFDIKTRNIIFDKDLSKIKINWEIPSGFILLCNN